MGETNLSLIALFSGMSVKNLRGFLNQNVEKKCPLSALERCPLYREFSYRETSEIWQGTKFAVRLREVSALESVHLERVDCTS